MTAATAARAAAMPTTVPAPGPVARAVVVRLHGWYRARRTRWVLAAVDDRLLEDIGAARTTAAPEVRRRPSLVV